MVIRNGKHTFLGHDNWYPFGLLKDKFGGRAIYDASINFLVLVKEVIKDFYQNLLIANSLDILKIQIALDYIPFGEKDNIIWLSNKNGFFSINLAWNKLRTKKNKVNRCNFVWFRKHFPRHSFVAWLTSKGKS